MATTAKHRPPTTGALIDSLWKIREEKREVEAKLADIGDRLKEIEAQVMERLGAEGLDKASGTKASVSISKNITADVQDWDLFWAFIAKKKYWHLVQKRVSDPGYRELLEAGTKVPGVVPFTKLRVNLRSLSS